MSDERYLGGVAAAVGSIAATANCHSFLTQRQILNWSGQASFAMSDERFGRYKTAAVY